MLPIICFEHVRRHLVSCKTHGCGFSWYTHHANPSPSRNSTSQRIIDFVNWRYNAIPPRKFALLHNRTSSYSPLYPMGFSIHPILKRRIPMVSTSRYRQHIRISYPRIPHNPPPLPMEPPSDIG